MQCRARVTIVNFSLRSHNYCMYSTTVDRYIVNKAQANYELAGKCIDIVVSRNRHASAQHCPDYGGSLVREEHFLGALALGPHTATISEPTLLQRNFPPIGNSVMYVEDIDDDGIQLTTHAVGPATGAVRSSRNLEGTEPAQVTDCLAAELKKVNEL
jgi:hypothetical protein